MSQAYVLIASEVGKDASIISALQNIEIVQEANGTFGLYDIVSKLDSSKEIIYDCLSNKIRKIKQIRSTLTLIVNDGLGFRKTTDVENEVLKKHMTQAYVILHCGNHAQSQIIDSLEKIPEVIDCNSLFGSYEIICKVVAPTFNDISEIISKKIRKIQDIKSTITLNIVTNQGFSKIT